MALETPPIPGPSESNPIGDATSVGGSRPFILGAVAVLLAAVLGADDGGNRSVAGGHDDLQMAIPVPSGTRLLVRSVDSTEGRSIAVLDLDPGNPPDWTDTVVVIRRRALPGVMVGYATQPVVLPPASASTDQWRAFAAGNAVRIDPHPDLRAAIAALGTLRP